MRKIIHIDIVSFFASVEQRDFLEFKSKPLVVGGRGPRYLLTRSYHVEFSGGYNPRKKTTQNKTHRWYVGQHYIYNI